MISHANAPTATPARSVTSDKIHAHQIHANRMVNVDDKVMTSNAFAHLIVKVNDAIWIRVMFAAAAHAKMVDHAVKVWTVHHSSACADLAIVEINAKLYQTHVDQTHACTVVNALA